MAHINPQLPADGQQAWAPTADAYLTTLTNQINLHDDEISALQANPGGGSTGGGGTSNPQSIDVRTISGFDQTGTTSISAVLNSALNQASSAGALKTVFVPASTTGNAYPLSTSVTLKSGVTLHFGDGSALRLANGFTGDAFVASTLTGARIRGLKIDGNASGAPSAGHLINITTSGSDFILSELSMSNAAGNGINLNAVVDAKIFRSSIDGTFFGINAVGCTRIVLEDVKVTNTKSFIDNHVAGIYIEDCDYGRMTRVDSSFNHGHGAYFGKTDYFSISDSSFHDNGYLSDAGTTTDEGWRRGLTLSSANPNTWFSMDTVLLYNNLENGILASSGNTYLTAQNCRAWNNNLQNAPGGHGFELNGQYTSISNCYATGNNGGFSVNGSNTTLTGCYAWANTNGVTPQGFKFYNGSGTRVIGCRSWAQDIGFDFNGDTGRVLSGISVIGCEAYGNTTYGMNFTDNVDGTTLTLDDNYAHDNATSQIHNSAVGYTPPPSGSAVTSSTIGQYFGWLNNGHETMPRVAIGSTSVPMNSGTVRFAFFTCRQQSTPSSIRIISGGTAAAPTPTLVKFGLYSVDVSGNMTLMAATASDTTRFSASSTAYTTPFSSSPGSLVVGNRYAIAAIVVTAAAAPTITGSQPGGFASEFAINPITTGTLGGATDLPATTSTSLLGQTSGLMYAVVV